MNQKELFKPNKLKIIIFMVLFIVSIVVYYSSFVGSALTLEEYNKMIKRGIKVTCREGAPSCTWLKPNFYHTYLSHFQLYILILIGFSI